jgi:drug/metabolite transporter (DMT)-like permease
MSSRTKAFIGLIISSLLWSSAGVGKIAVRTFDPFTASFLRFAVASIAILPFFLRENWKQKHILRDLVPLSLLCTINITFYYIGLKYSSANAAVLIYAGVPLLTLLFAHRILRETFTLKKLIGISIGFIGVLFVVVFPMCQKNVQIGGDITGNIFFLIAIIAFTFYTIGSRRATAIQKYSPTLVTSVFIFTTTIVLGAISCFTFRSSYVTSLFSPSVFFLVIYLGIFLTVAPYLIFQKVIKHSSASVGALGNYIQPATSIVFNILFLQESFTFVFLVGGILIFTGIVISNGSGFWEKIRVWIRT